MQFVIALDMSFIITNFFYLLFLLLVLFLEGRGVGGQRRLGKPLSWNTNFLVTATGFESTTT